jgi:single-strand DNA-binding protein
MTQIITISGNVGKDAELRSVRDSQVLGFSVAVKNGFGRDADSIWYRCSLWGKAAEAFAGSIKKGVKVFITGDLIHDEHEGKPQFNVRVNSIDTGPKVESQGAGGGNNAATTGQQSSNYGGGNLDQDLDDDLPFITANCAYEARCL